MANKSNWKGFEREVASMIDTERTPLSGGNSKHTRSDSLSKTIFAECKKRVKFSLHSLFRETKELAKKEGKLPIVVTKETGKQLTLVTLEATPELMKLIKQYSEEIWEK
jgi:hypothetical protein